ncbi:hypothetical protein DAPPUDRAFT_241939 [Daphnia pulex]|uniref:Uncharacterized protein n=1 Tax=Daphnia pulex TaxID=6669 RepID=E9GFF6_DAPPU|nr:hypothetical protein DAPPUDRAFT_241939 [Daphnia pulex]|eukprot:EFX81820.1 hypothetical protein DAPPUDRAFT_241939 [Daphnia pulex]
MRETPTKKKAVKHESVLASGAGMSAFLPKESARQTEITVMRVSSHFLVGTRHCCQSVCHSHCHRLLLPQLMNGRTKARTKRIERNKRKDRHSSFPQ